MTDLDEDKPRSVTVSRRLAGVILLWICLITAGMGWGLLRQARITNDIEAENLARREAACADANESRGTIRQLSKDAPLEVGEALIEVAPNAKPEVVQAFREAMDRRLTTIVNQLPNRHWDARIEECVDAGVQGEPGE